MRVCSCVRKNAAFFPFSPFVCSIEWCDDSNSFPSDFNERTWEFSRCGVFFFPFTPWFPPFPFLFLLSLYHLCSLYMPPFKRILRDSAPLPAFSSFILCIFMPLARSRIFLTLFPTLEIVLAIISFSDLCFARRPLLFLFFTSFSPSVFVAVPFATYSMKELLSFPRLLATRRSDFPYSVPSFLIQFSSCFHLPVFSLFIFPISTAFRPLVIFLHWTRI